MTAPVAEPFALVSEDDLEMILATITGNGDISVPDNYAGLMQRISIYGAAQRGIIAAKLAFRIRQRLLDGWLPDKGTTSPMRIAAGFLKVGHSTVSRAMAIERQDPASLELVARGESNIQAVYHRVYTDPLAAGEIQKLPFLKRADKGRPIVFKVSQSGRKPHLTHPRHGKAAKDRMVRGLSMIRGICSSLPDPQLEPFRAILSPEEIETWTGMARSAAHTLYAFARELEEERRDG